MVLIPLPAQVMADRFLRTHPMRIHLDIYEKMLIVFLASYIGRKNECYPSFKSLAIDCSISIDTVKRKIRLLEKKEIIRVSRGRGKNNRYQFHEQLGAGSTYYPVLPAPRVGAPSTPNIHHNNIIKDGAWGKTNSRGPRLHKNFFPENMMINEAHKILASELTVDVESEFEKFKEWHLAKGSQFACWGSAFNHWLRKSAEFKQNKYYQAFDIMDGVGYE